jgi:hypothetical protein
MNAIFCLNLHGNHKQSRRRHCAFLLEREKKKVGLCSKACFGIYQPQAARNKIVFAVKFVF